jgi:hypothetical protein
MQKSKLYLFLEKLRYDTAILIFLGIIEILHLVIEERPTNNQCYKELFPLLNIINRLIFWFVFLFWTIRRIFKIKM